MMEKNLKKGLVIIAAIAIIMMFLCGVVNTLIFLFYCAVFALLTALMGIVFQALREAAKGHIEE
jgi:hypothetical protein